MPLTKSAKFLSNIRSKFPFNFVRAMLQDVGATEEAQRSWDTIPQLSESNPNERKQLAIRAQKHFLIFLLISELRTAFVMWRRRRKAPKVPRMGK